MPKIEDRKLTPKENIMRMFHHEQEEWVPVYTMGMPLPDGEPIPLTMISPYIIGKHNFTDDGIDCWGVHWVGSDSASGGRLPEPNNFMLEDVCDWHDIIKAPSLEGIDWEDMAKKDLARSGIDREITAVGQDTFIGAFQMLAAFMGFTGAMIAMAEEPEEVHALLDYIMDFYCEVQHKYYEAMKPDVIIMADDTCAYAKPFISETMFREFFIPCYKRACELPNEVGIPIDFHNCGCAANFIEITHEEAGITSWDPCQDSNDMVAFKEKHQDDICIMGCFDARGELLEPNCPDELIAEAARKSIDTYAPNGGYAFLGMFIGSVTNPDIARKNTTLLRAASAYCHTFYDD